LRRLNTIPPVKSRLLAVKANKTLLKPKKSIIDKIIFTFVIVYFIPLKERSYCASKLPTRGHRLVYSPISYKKIKFYMLWNIEHFMTNLTGAKTHG